MWEDFIQKCRDKLLTPSDTFLQEWFDKLPENEKQKITKEINEEIDNWKKEKERKEGVLLL